MSKIVEEDVKRLASLLMNITNNAEFKLKINDFVSVFNDLEWAKTGLLPKLQANIFEVKEVKQAAPKKTPAKKVK